jgi:hypothetical protein
MVHESLRSLKRSKKILGNKYFSLNLPVAVVADCPGSPSVFALKKLSRKYNYFNFSINIRGKINVKKIKNVTYKMINTYKKIS